MISKMLQSILFFSLVFTLYAALEWYGWQAIKTVFSPETVKILRWVYWGFTAVLFLIFLSYRPFLHKYMPRNLSVYLAVTFVVLLLSKFVVLLFLLPEDISRLVRFGIAKFSSSPAAAQGITRSEFLSKLALVAAAIPAGTLIYGVIANAYNYQFKKVALRFPNLPEAFHGFKIVQLSDIHSGSFTKTEPIEKVVAKINALNADIILFTGDLVNNVSDEMEPFMKIFDKLRAKHGVLSITGNHDYGDYVQWDSASEKKANFERFKGVHKNLGWDLLMNENRVLERDGQKIAIHGVENWGGGRFAKYGKFEKAMQGTEEIPFKILMSHDPSSWDSKIRTEYPHVDLTLSGHTHGFQFGIESRWLKWSPSQYVYKQWAGLYREGRQLLYVNRGFGFLGYPGRVGILPEVTELTLLKA
jgi:predicted MPP superfamily phosphohydrolase